MSVNMLVRLTAHRLRGRRLRSSLGFVVSPVAVIGALPSCEAAPCRRGSRWGFTRGPGPTVYAIPVLGAGGRREEKKLPGNPGASEMLTSSCRPTRITPVRQAQFYGCALRAGQHRLRRHAFLPDFEGF